jgi:hypothetical protein
MFSVMGFWESPISRITSPALSTPFTYLSHSDRLYLGILRETTSCPAPRTRTIPSCGTISPNSLLWDVSPHPVVLIVGLDMPFSKQPNDFYKPKGSSAQVPSFSSSQLQSMLLCIPNNYFTNTSNYALVWETSLRFYGAPMAVAVHSLIMIRYLT